MKKLFSTILITILILISFQFIFSHLPFKENQPTAVTSVRAAKNSPPEFGTLKIIDWSGGRFEEFGYGNPIIGLLLAIFNWFLKIASVLAVIAFVYSGIMYISSAGNPEKAEKAKKNMLWAILAIVIIIVCLIVPDWIYNILTAEAPK
jgi:amino acid transporter